jgi:hypothetical protein
MPSWATGWATGDIVTAAEFRKGVGAIYDTTLGAPAASIDITGILGSYPHLMIKLYQQAAGGNIMLRFNGDAAANYDYQTFLGSATAAFVAENFAQTGILVGFTTGGGAGANVFQATTIFIPHYANSVNNKVAISLLAHKNSVVGGGLTAGMSTGFWRSNAAINRITISPVSGNLAAGTRLTLYAMGA